MSKNIYTLNDIIFESAVKTGYSKDNLEKCRQSNEPFGGSL